MKRYTSYNDKLQCYVVDNNKLDIEQEQIGYYDRAESIYTGGAIDSLAEYENAEEDGLLIRLPCPIGKEIYRIGLEIPEDEEQCSECVNNHSGFGEFYCDLNYGSAWPFMEDKLDGKHNVCPRFKPYIYQRKFDLSFYHSYEKWLGITWFLTLEEAEAKLAEFNSEVG